MNKTKPSIICLIVVMWICHFLVDFMIGIWPVYKTIAGLDIAAAGLIAGASALVGEGLQGFFGPLTDRGHRQKLMIFGITLTLSSAFMAYTENYFLLFVIFLVTCIGSGAFHPSAASVIDELSENQKALFMTIFQSGGYLGLALSQLIFSQIYFLLEGHTLFLGIPSVLLIAFLSFKGYGSQVITKTTAKKNNWGTFLRFFKSKELFGLYCTQLCNQSVFWGTVFLLPDVLLSRGYDSWICFGGAHLFLIFGAAAMMIPAGFLADRYSCKSVILVSFLGGIGSFYLFLVNPYLSPLVLCILLLFLGAALGTVSPVVVALGNKLSPNNSGMIAAFLMGLVWCLSEGIGQGGGGLLTKLFSENAAAYSLACLGLLMIVGTVSTIRLPSDETSLQLEIV